MAGERLTWMDELKGIGMCCVILSHMTIPKPIVHAIFSFHMPLFFFASGYLYRQNLSGVWVLRKLDSLLIPFLIYSWLGVVIRPFWYGEAMSSLVKGPLIGNGLGFTWFFMALLLAELLGALIVRFTNGRTFLLGMVATFLAALGFLYERNGWPCICMSAIIPQATVLWIVGWLFKKENVFDRLIRVRSIVFRCAILSVLLCLCALSFAQRVDMSSVRTGNPLLFYGTAISFVTVIAIALIVLKRQSRVLSYIGRNSLLFLAGSQFIPLTLVRGLESCGLMVNSNGVAKLAERVVALGLVFAFVWVANRYAPLLCGKTRLFSRLNKGNV